MASNPEILQKVLDALRAVKGPSTTGEYTAHCPAHEDKRSSLCISQSADGKVLLHCQAGCKTPDVVNAAGLKMRDLFPKENDKGRQQQLAKPAQQKTPEPVRTDAEILADVSRAETKPKPKGTRDTYIYVDENNQPKYKVVRTPDKQFPQYHYDADSKKWVKGMDNVERLPYNLPNLIKAVESDNYIFITEGEKDVNTLFAHKFPATCNSGGAGKWLPSFAKYFQGASVIIIPDNDKPGCDHALDVACSLSPVAKEIRILKLDVPHKGDVSDWFLTGGDESAFMELALQSPIWHPGDTLEPWGETKGLLGTATSIKSTVYSQVYNAELFYEMHGDNVRYCPNNKEWYVWDTKVWQLDELGRIKRMMLDCIKSLYALLPEMSRNEAEQLMRHIKSSENVKSIDGALDAVKLMDNVTIREDSFDCNPYLISVQNGTINLKTGTLQPFKRENMITVQMPVSYDPDATCPRFEEFVSQIFPGDPDTQAYVQRMCGYFLMGANKRQECYFFFGKPSTGKSVLAETINNILGEHSSPIMKSSLLENPHGGTNDRQGVAKTWMKHLVTCSEFSSTDKLDENLVKSLAGGDAMTVRKLYGDPFTVYPRLKLLLYTNFIPKFKRTGYDMRKRLRMIPFTQSFYAPEENKWPVRDNDLKDKLIAESAGILAWMVRGCKDCLEQGNPESKAITECTDSCFEEQDPLSEFLDSEYVFDFKSETLLKDIWADLQNYCENNARRPIFRDSRSLKSSLQNRDGISFFKNRNKQVVVAGLRAIKQGPELNYYSAEYTEGEEYSYGDTVEI